MTADDRASWLAGDAHPRWYWPLVAVAAVPLAVVAGFARWAATRYA